MGLEPTSLRAAVERPRQLQRPERAGIVWGLRLPRFSQKTPYLDTTHSGLRKSTSVRV